MYFKNLTEKGIRGVKTQKTRWKKYLTLGFRVTCINSNYFLPLFSFLGTEHFFLNKVFFLACLSNKSMNWNQPIIVSAKNFKIIFLMFVHLYLMVYERCSVGEIIRPSFEECLLNQNTEKYTYF